MPLITSMEEIAKEEGIQIGEQRGIQLGKQEGIQIATEQVARNMLAAGMDPAQVVSLTELSLERIRQLNSES